jgi:hypothetical protein
LWRMAKRPDRLTVERLGQVDEGVVHLTSLFAALCPEPTL